MKPYIHWPDKMDTKKARLLSDVAILFSRQSCNYNRNTSHKSDALGYSEILTDAHLQHDFLLDQDITLDVLRRYKALILPACECMSREQVDAVTEYVRSGGGLIVSCRAGLLDENRLKDEERIPLATLAGVEIGEGVSC